MALVVHPPEAVRGAIRGTLCALAKRSTARRRLAVVLADNAPGHQVGKTGIMRRFLDALAGQVVLVFQPKHSPELQPVERLWRQWPQNVTHNHTRGALEELEGDSDRWLEAEPKSAI